MSTSRSPITRRRTASATTSRRMSCGARSSACARSNEALEGISVLAGSEVNVLPDGELDYEQELLQELDWVVASVHTAFAMAEQAMTERVLAAVEHPLVDAIGHPTGRLIEQREPYAIDLGAVVRGGGAHRHAARDQRQPATARPLRRPRPQRRAGGRGDRDRLRRAPHPDAREHALGDRHSQTRVAGEAGRGKHAALARAGALAQTQSRACATHGQR